MARSLLLYYAMNRDFYTVLSAPVDDAYPGRNPGPEGGGELAPSRSHRNSAQVGHFIASLFNGAEMGGSETITNQLTGACPGQLAVDARRDENPRPDSWLSRYEF